MQSIFMTGATGAIGKEILPILAEKNTVYALVRKSPAQIMKNVEWVVGDIGRIDSYFSYLRGCDALIHLAADVSNDSEELHRVNVTASRELVLAAHQQGICKIIVFSTAAVSKNYLTPYSESKKEMEKMLKELNIPIVLLRPTLVYEKGSRYIRQMEKFSQLPLLFIPLPNGNLADLRPVHSRDVGKSVRAILSHPFPAHTVTYDVCPEEPFTLAQAMHAIAEKKGITKPIVNVPHTFFGEIYSFLGKPRIKPVLMMGKLAAAGESYHVNPKPFIEKYGVKCADPNVEFPKCIE